MMATMPRATVAISRLLRSRSSQQAVAVAALTGVTFEYQAELDAKLAELAKLDAELAKTDDARAANDEAPHEIAA
jgi:hypothetical protein